ncbi:MAG: ABC transporter permease [Peptococcaceae bacterium]|jgi:ABC-2 type transport system permease protein|nr:ABC transporter permease [Peptococcaceae bacterium]
MKDMAQRCIRKALSFLLKYKPLLVIVALPIFFTFLFGAVFSKVYIQAIPIAVLDQDGTADARVVAEQLADSEGIRIIGNVDSIEQMEHLLLRGEINGGVVFPPGFSQDLRSAQSPRLMVVIDFSNIVIGNHLLAYANTVLNTLNASLSVHTLEAGKIVPYVAEQTVTTLTFAERMLYDPHLAYFTYMYAIILAVMIQQTYLSMLTPALVEEKLRTQGMMNLRKCARWILSRIGFSLLGALGSLAVAHFVFHYPVHGSVFLVALLQILFLINLTIIAVLMTVFFKDVSHCGQFIVMLSIPTILLSGYIWPKFMMASWFAGLIRVIWPLYYFINPLKDLCVKGVGYAEIQSYLAGACIFACAWGIVALVAYQWRRRVRG